MPNAQLQPKPAPLTKKDFADFGDALNRALDILQRFKSVPTARERMFLELGLRSAHAEEALATGELERAREHLVHVLQIAQQLATK